MNKNASLKSISSNTDKVAKLTTDEKIYRQIYLAIMDHQLVPNTKLPEDALAESFKVSRTIIRKVLLTLTHDGLVVTAPKRGARVAHPSIQESKEVFDARRVIEAGALPLVIQKINKSEIKHLNDINKQQIAAEKAQDAKKVIRLAADFHLELMLASGNNSLYEYLRRLVSSSSLIEYIYGSKNKHFHKCNGHSELLDLISQQEVDKSKQWMHDHLLEIEGRLEFFEPDTGNPDFKEMFS